MSTQQAPRPTIATPGSGRESRMVIIAAIVTVVLWASAFVVIRSVGEHFGPGSMALLRMVVGSIVLGLIAVVMRVRLPRWRDLPLIAVWGIAWFGLYNLALNGAEAELDAGTTAMIVNIAPLFVVLLAGLILREGFPRPLVCGAPLAFVGVTLIASASWTGDFALRGVLLAFGAAVLYAGAALLQKRLLRNTNATSLTFTGAAAGTVMLLPWSGEMFTDIVNAPLTATLGVVYLGVFPTAIAFTTWAYVLSRTTAGKTVATTYVVPALVLLMSWFFLAEVPTPIMLLGGALCLGGVFITRLPSRRGGRTART